MIRFRHIRLRSVTADAVYGADIALKDGLNVIQADNTSGKSTSVLSIVYGLGLERALGAKLDVPLPYAMRERIERTPESAYEPVLESYVMLDIENANRERLTIRRDIAGGVDKKLIRSWRGTLEDVDRGATFQRDFFLFDQGAAAREDGFHHYLARFIGWDLPTVPRFDGMEGPLYVEALFPLFFVEQKRGWATILGPLPTFFGIQDLSRRVMEFVLDLDAGKVRRQVAELRKALSLVEARYREHRKDLLEGSGNLVRVEGLPTVPTAEFARSGTARLTVYHDDQWILLEEGARDLTKRIKTFEQAELKALNEAEGDLKHQLSDAERRERDLNGKVALLREDYQLAIGEKQAFENRIEVITHPHARTTRRLSWAQEWPGRCGWR